MRCAGGMVKVITMHLTRAALYERDGARKTTQVEEDEKKAESRLQSISKGLMDLGLTSVGNKVPEKQSSGVKISKAPREFTKETLKDYS